LDIAGNVLDKLQNPVPGAKVCIKSDPSSCVTTDADGAFHLSKAIAIRNPGPAASGFSLAYRRGSLIVHSPAAVPARLEWLSTDGRRAFSASDIKLSAGANALPLPAGLPSAGLIILRLSTADQTLTWKAVLAPGAASPATSSASASPRIASLAKAAAATLEITKTGYRTRSYEPGAETETDVVLYLSLAGDAGIVLSGTLDDKVLAIDRAKKTIITAYVDAYCDSGSGTQVVHDTSEDTANYVVRDGKLWTWAQESCTGSMFTGTATDIVGHWTMSDANALLPDDLRAGCVADPASGETPFESFTAVYDITESKITGTLSAELCPGDFLGAIFTEAFGADTSVILTKNTCQEIVYKNGKGETATFDFSKKGDSLHTTYAYKTSACAMDMDFGLSQKDPVCPEGEGLYEFMTCVEGTGFLNIATLAKTSALAKTAANLPSPLPMSLERRAAPVLAKAQRSGWFAPLRNPARGGEYISRIWKTAPPRK
jgi:hypothetical protein